MKNYYLCSKAVVEHFPNLIKSKPFKSGFDYDNEDEFFVVKTENFAKISSYYYEVIEPFNEKSRIDDIDFWIREVCDSLLDSAPKGCILKCKRDGVFLTIQKVWDLTNVQNQAYAIYKMAEYYGINPIEFINRIV